MEELTRAFHDISMRAYQQAGPQAGAGPGAGPQEEPKQGPVDAEYKVVDEEE
jgi:hypothetical protein